MKKINKKLLMLSIFALSFALATSFAFAKGSSDKGSSNKIEKSSKSEELKNFEKPSSGKTNAEIYKKNTEKVSEQLKNMGKDKKIEEMNEVGDSSTAKNDPASETKENSIEEEISEEAEEIAEEIADTSDETAGAIEEVEGQNKFKKLLIGTDYNNLGQLRSSLVQNRNQIRKLTMLAEKVQTQTQNKNLLTDAEIQNQLTLLMQERERVKSVIQTNESGFSILGWAAKLISGYSDEPINEEEEAQIEEEVLDVLAGEDEAVGGMMGDTLETEIPAE